MKLAIALTLISSLAFAEAPISRSLAVTVHGKTTTFSTAQLRAMTQAQTKVHNEHENTDETYGGVRLEDLFTRLGLPDDKATHHERLHDYIVARGTDQYFAVYSFIEVEAMEHDGDVIVAVTKDGKPLTADGEIKLVSSGDKRAHRWVRNLAAVAVKEATASP